MILKMSFCCNKHVLMLIENIFWHVHFHYSKTYWKYFSDWNNWENTFHWPRKVWKSNVNVIFKTPVMLNYKVIKKENAIYSFPMQYYWYYNLYNNSCILFICPQEKSYAPWNSKYNTFLFNLFQRRILRTGEPMGFPLRNDKSMPKMVAASSAGWIPWVFKIT